ncbi:MAG: ROK family protein [Gemmataceae bacterium]|nr:ROK family protein [Gemmataceae bacterium]
MPADDSWAVGLDVGGTKIAGGLIRFPAGEVVAHHRTPTRAGRDPADILADAVGMARDLRNGVPAGGRFVGVGLGVPELVDPAGRITSGAGVDWRGVDLVAKFAGVGPVWVEADVRAAALAEARFGAGRSFPVFAYVTVGTGISSALVQDGRPYAGARGNALVLASGPVSVHCPGCGAWARAVLEEVASGPALAAAVGADRAEEVLAAAGRGDPDAVRAVRDAAEALGSGIGWLVNVLDPGAVVVGGGLGLAGGLYWDLLTDAVRRHVWAESSRDLPIVPAELGADAGLVGAALHAALRMA